MGTRSTSPPRRPRTGPRKRSGRRKPWPLANDARWRKMAASWLDAHPWCARCLVRRTHRGGGLRRVAEQVDHIIPLRLAPDRAYDESNLQSLCMRCHNIKSGHERSGRCYDYERRLVHVVTQP